MKAPTSATPHSPQPPRRRSSLQQRLIINVGLLTLAGLSSITGWAAVQMRQQLIGSHKQHLEAIAQLVPEQLEAARSLPPAIGQSTPTSPASPSDDPDISRELSQIIQSSLSELTRLDPLQKNTLLWVRDDQQTLIAQSNWAEKDAISSEHLAPMVGSMIKLVHWDDRYFLACRRRIPWSGDIERSGDIDSRSPSPQYLDLYLAHDVTAQKKMIKLGLGKLLLADLLITLICMGAIAAIVRQGLAPIARINHLAQDISVSDLQATRLAEDQAPEEIQALVEGFNAMLGRLSQAWEQQRQFVNDASHELRTPLAIVDGYLQSLLRRRQKLNPQQLEAIETAAEETQRTIQMLQEMLTIARADSGQLKCELQPVALKPLLQDVERRTENIYQRTVKLELPETPITALVDLEHLHQVLLYLVDNAVKYSDSQSEICLRLASLRSETGEDWINLAVIDRGIGIPPEQQRCIFERFYRADEARHRKGGTGLGLSLTKTLVEAMGGHITVSSKLNHGSTFTLHLRPAPAT